MRPKLAARVGGTLLVIALVLVGCSEPASIAPSSPAGLETLDHVRQLMLEESLLTVEELPSGFEVSKFGAGQPRVRLCGGSKPPPPAHLLERRASFERRAHGQIVEEGLALFASGDAARYLDAMRASGSSCETWSDTSLGTSGRFEIAPRIGPADAVSFRVSHRVGSTDVVTDLIYANEADVVITLAASSTPQSPAIDTIEIIEAARRRVQAHPQPRE